MSDRHDEAGHVRRTHAFEPTHRHALANTPALTLALALALGPLACTAHAPPPAPPVDDTPPVEKTPPADPTVASPRPEDRLAPCLPGPDADVLALEAALERAFEQEDARCWTALEIVLAHALLEASDDLQEEARERQRRLAAYRFRQAELRADRHAFDDLAALAHRGRARVAMKAGDRDAVLTHLAHAKRSVGLHAAATGDAAADLDALLVERMVETLAAWEHRGDDALYAAAVETASELKAREVMRAFSEAGVGVSDLARVAGDDALAALALLAEHSERSRTTFGRKNRAGVEMRQVAGETVLQNAAGWVAAAPLLVGWLPAALPEILVGVQAVFGPGEVLLDYSVGEEHGALLVLGESGLAARPIPGRAALESAIAACHAGDCEAFDRAVLRPAADAVTGARQILVAAHGPLHDAPFEARIDAPALPLPGRWRAPLHDAPFEARIDGPRVVRIPSALGLTILRLRAWESGPRAQPAAADLVAGEGWPRLDPGDDPAEPRLGAATLDRALPALWAALSAGAQLVDWQAGDGDGRLFGAPLTVPGLAEPLDGEAAEDDQTEAASE